MLPGRLMAHSVYSQALTRCACDIGLHWPTARSSDFYWRSSSRGHPFGWGQLTVDVVLTSLVPEKWSLHAGSSEIETETKGHR